MSFFLGEVNNREDLGFSCKVGTAVCSSSLRSSSSFTCVLQSLAVIGNVIEARVRTSLRKTLNENVNFRNSASVLSLLRRCIRVSCVLYEFKET